MAAAFVAAGAVSSGAGTSATPALPAGVAAGDVMLLVAFVRKSDNLGITAPSGWTLVTSASDGTLRRHFVWSRTYQAGDTAPTVSWSSSVAFLAVVVGYTGVLTTVAGSTSGTGSSSPATSTSGTTSQANSMIVDTFGENSNTSFGTPSQGTSRVNATTAAGLAAGLAVSDYTQVAAGATTGTTRTSAPAWQGVAVFLSPVAAKVAKVQGETMGGLTSARVDATNPRTTKTGKVQGQTMGGLAPANVVATSRRKARHPRRELIWVSDLSGTQRGVIG